MEYEIDDDELVSMSVVKAVSTVEDKDPLDLPPLAHVVDTDALDVLFENNGFGEPKTGGKLSFIYSESRITIENGEYLSVQPVNESQTDSHEHLNRSDR